jgi:hypothetical protein
VTTRKCPPLACPRLPRNSPPSLRIPVVAVLLILFLALPVSSYSSEKKAKKEKAEDDYALLFGTVWGPDNRPVYGIKVKIRRASEKKARWEVYSDHNGEFAQRLPTGRQDYLVWADKKDLKLQDGKQLELVTDVPVHIEFNERTDIGLHLK